MYLPMTSDVCSLAPVSCSCGQRMGATSYLVVVGGPLNGTWIHAVNVVSQKILVLVVFTICIC